VVKAKKSYPIVLRMILYHNCRIGVEARDWAARVYRPEIRDKWDQVYKANGVEDAVGKEASSVPPDMDRDAYGARVRAKLAGLEEIAAPTGYQLIAPMIDRFLTEHLFAD